MKIHGLEVRNVTHKRPGVNLPKFVRETAETRGYGDSTQPLSLFIQDGDIAEAFACAAQGNGSACVMAQAGMRIGAKAVYFYRTTAWVDFGEGPIVRFSTARSIYSNVIEPFDRGDRDAVTPGVYHLMPPNPSKSLNVVRNRNRDRKNPAGKSDGSRSMVAQHSERVVMASRAKA